MALGRRRAPSVWTCRRGQPRRRPDESNRLAGSKPNLSSWSRRIGGHGDFEGFPAIPVFARFVAIVRNSLMLVMPSKQAGNDEVRSLLGPVLPRLSLVTV